MGFQVPIAEPPVFGDFRHKLPWFLPAVLSTWMMLAGLSIVLSQRPPRRRPNSGAIEVHLIQPPPAGLQAEETRTAALPIKPQLKLVKRVPTRKAAPRKIPPPIPSLATITTSKESGLATGLPATSPETGREESASLGNGSGSGGLIGSDSFGARAIYAPVPKIPDDMRDQIFQTEAVAHFTVSHEGTVRVALSKPTNNLRLNQILLSTLSRWQFFPALKDGEPIDSVFDVRIPITVQ